MAMKIGVLGTGDVGQVLGAGFAKKGHQVMLGSRDAKNAKAKAWVEKTGSGVSAGTFADAAKFGDVIVLATLWAGGATENALKLASIENFKGKVVIDATNPLEMGPKGPALALGHTDSGGEQVQRWIPAAKVVKCFNTVGNAHMVDPNFVNGPPTMFICGDDAGAKKTVEGICKELGQDPVDVGGIESSRLLEPMCILWVRYALMTGPSWNHAFKLLRK